MSSAPKDAFMGVDTTISRKIDQYFIEMLHFPQELLVSFNTSLGQPE